MRHDSSRRRESILALAGALTLTACAAPTAVPDLPGQAAGADAVPVAEARPSATLAAAQFVDRPAAAQGQSRLAPRHPDRYTVVPGDTLWDIASLFLRDPWFWPEIWHVNPQIGNPHLIYPGDIITLVYVDGQPQLRLERGEAAVTPLPPGTSVERLSPRVRVDSLDAAIPTIPYDVIAPFLSRPTVLSKRQVKQSPYVLTPEQGHMIAGKGIDVYARGDGLSNGANYGIYHVGEPLRDPDSNKVIGYSAVYVGQGRVLREGDPAKVALTETRREALAGDLLLPLETDVPLNFYPSAPDSSVEGRIIEVIDGISIIGQYQIVVLNRGLEDGLAQGNVLEVFQTGEVIRDRYKRGVFGKRVRLPEERAGTVLIFRVLDEISYALVMSATSEIRILDTVRNPEA